VQLTVSNKIMRQIYPLYTYYQFAPLLNVTYLFKSLLMSI